MTQTGIVSKQRTVSRTTASVSNHQLTQTKSKTRLIQVTRRHLKIRLKRRPNGLIRINLQRKRNMKGNRRSLKELLYQFFRKWEVVLQVQEECQTWEAWVVCLIWAEWEECQTWEAWVVCLIWADWEECQTWEAWVVCLIWA